MPTLAEVLIPYAKISLELSEKEASESIMFALIMRDKPQTNEEEMIQDISYAFAYISSIPSNDAKRHIIRLELIPIFVSLAKHPNSNIAWASLCILGHFCLVSYK